MLEVTQTCDSCKKGRPLDASQGPLTDLVVRDGWIQVLGNKHICAKCLRDLTAN